MRIREVIEKLESYAKEYGDDIPVRVFDLDREMSDVGDIDVSIDHHRQQYIYIDCC